MPAPRAVIWDMDGTLVDSSDYHRLAWKEALATVGYDMTDADFARTFGLRNDSILRLLLGEDVTAETIRQVETGKEAEYRRRVREDGLELLPGVARWLEHLRRDGWRQAVGSSAPKQNVDLVLDATGTARYFDVVITGGDVSKGKPDPEVYFAAAVRLGVPIDRCVVIEDAPSAIQGALSAGIRTVAVLHRVESHGADLEVDDLDQLPDDAFDRLLSA